MSFNAPYSGGNNQPQKPSKPRGPVGLLIVSAILLIVGVAWLALFQNNLEVESSSFAYWAPYIPTILGAIGFILALKKAKRR